MLWRKAREEEGAAAVENGAAGSDVESAVRAATAAPLSSAKRLRLHRQGAETSYVLMKRRDRDLLELHHGNDEADHPQTQG